MTTKRRFFYHYNKPLSQKLGEVIWSVHFKDTCYFTRKIECWVPCESKSNRTQPYATMIGFADQVVASFENKKDKKTNIYDLVKIRENAE